MPAPKSIKKWVVVGLIAAGLLAGGAATLWVERKPILTWYFMRGLARATDADRALWVDRVAGLGEDGEPGVLGCLGQADDAADRNAGAVLDKWAAQWGADDRRAAALAERLAQGFGGCSPTGRRVVLEAAAAWFKPGAAKPSDALLSSCTNLVASSAKTAEPEAHAAALALCSLVLDRTDDAKEMQSAGRDLVKKALRDEPAAVRLRAVQTSLHPGLDAPEETTVLLRDPAPEVRRAAVLAVGPLDERTAPAKNLLPLLHDADADVRQACEEVLRKDRRLSPECFRIGWCLCHPDPAERINVLDHLRSADVEPGVWLRELSHDDSPAVRLAAVRVMSQQHVVDLSDRLEQMADGDPSPTVCQMARLYQKMAKNAGRGVER